MGLNSEVNYILKGFDKRGHELGACAVGRFSSGRMIRDRGNFVLTTVVPDIGMGNRRSVPPRGVIRSPIGSMAVPNRRHRTPIPVTRSPEALASA